ncbi:MAG: hypothetical protein KJN79_00770 [Gammaproteobacteria bacterium]|nr:hypothetical protein [Gammaproteobacteria bacterium]
MQKTAPSRRLIGKRTPFAIVKGRLFMSRSLARAAIEYLIPDTGGLLFGFFIMQAQIQGDALEAV